MQNFRTALIQITSSNHLQENLTKIENFLKEAKSKGAQLVCLPENFSFFGTEKEKLANLKEISEKTQNFLSEESKKHGIFLLGGGYPFPTQANPSGQNPDTCYNQASIYNPDGKEILRYRKMHLFDTDPGDGVSYQESKTVTAGESTPDVVGIGDLCRLTTFICYDIRFPEVFRIASRNGAEVICLPAAFTIPTGQAHWEVLLRARAIENFCYIIAPAQVGVHDEKSKRKTYGHSMVVNPWGEIIGELETEEGVLVVDLDAKVLEESRARIPALKHRRL
ncbi:MAG: carbon-nitrogen hydrolase family protein [Leptospira sp.]|nr:carbon-nitrogen hydrolase family protein [Leptospira sp.]